MTAIQTAAGANGQKVERTLKNKELHFPSQIELEKYILKLIEIQEGLCAITDLTLQFDREETDSEMLCSLDRIDSGGHYAPGNLQIVCKFVNRWKGSSDDESFRRLIRDVRAIQSV